MPLDLNTLIVRPISGSIGAEIDGVDLTDISDEQFADIRTANDTYGVIFFREQKMSPDQHIAFAKRRGNIVINLVEHHALKEVKMDKAAFMAAIKEFLKRTVGHMKENGQEENIKTYRAQATEFVKFVVGKFADFTIYTGENGDATGHLAF